jgi:serine/threonine protein kinase
MLVQTSEQCGTVLRPDPFPPGQEEVRQQLRAGQGHGLVLGQYRLLELLGAGGMGQVYKAEHLLMKRCVALKVLTAPPGDTQTRNDAEAQERFLREVQAAAQLSHANIVTAFDAGVAGGLYYLVMEFVDGIDLGRLVAETGPLAVSLACECVRQAALGLQYAHECGLIHRDIKPSNLLLQRRAKDSARGSSVQALYPRVKILDLGLARLAADAQREPPPPPGQAVAGSGLAGTPDFLAPEAAYDARSADIRSDLYSLGCAFYYLLTAHVPFPGGTWTEKVLRHRLDAPVQVRALRPEIPTAVETVLLRLMAKEPAERFQEPDELARKVQALLQSWEKTRKEASPAAVHHGIDTPLSVDCFTWSELDNRQTLLAPSLARRAALAESVLVPGNHGAGRAWHVSYPAAVAGAVLLGLSGAWLVRLPASLGLGSVVGEQVSPVRVAFPFVLESQGRSFADLAAAVSAAQDGDTILIQGNSALQTGPLRLEGKALALRAAPDCQPSLQLVSSPPFRHWQPLLNTDRALTIEGLGLSRLPASDRAHETGATYLIVTAGAPLSLRGCRIELPADQGAILCHDPSAVELRDCSIAGQGVALCIETGNGLPCDLRLAGNRILMEGTTAAALSIWTPEIRQPGQVHVTLEGNAVQASRILALTAVPSLVEVDAWGNDLAFHEALLSHVGVGDSFNERANIVWHGRENRYHHAGSWLRVNGVPAAIHDLLAWNAFWDRPEPGSSEYPLSRFVRGGALSP